MADVLNIFKEVEMFCFDIQNDAVFRIKMQEAVRVFARFRQEEIGLAYPQVAVERFKIPPTVMVGSHLAARRIWLIMEVVVVLPWVPATAMELR